MAPEQHSHNEPVPPLEVPLEGDVRTGRQNIVRASTIDFVTVEKQGRITVLKCRTPGEAILVANELEAADILVNLPKDEELWDEFKRHGFVSLRVSAQSYEAAKEVQALVETRHWFDPTIKPLSVTMAVVAVLCGLIFIPGIFFVILIRQSHKRNGYTRKAKHFLIWYLVGLTLLFSWFAVSMLLYP